MNNLELRLVNRTRPVFRADFQKNLADIAQLVSSSRILVVGGAGSIGSTVVRMLFDLAPKALHVLDINENGLADLVRSLRSSSGYTTEDFQTICYDLLHPDANWLFENGRPYDVILNFAAVKHVRSEKDSFSLSRMFAVNVQLMRHLARWADLCAASTLFSVSTDKAANPANLMGASKNLMEMVSFVHGRGRFSTARFANVAFSNGSLLKAFWDRLDQGHPISAPSNIKRFFITHDEAAQLCLLAAFIAPKGTIAIPMADGEIELTSFVDVVTNILASRRLKPALCASEEEARATKPTARSWPCYFFESDTSGEKVFEEFVAEGEHLIDTPFSEISLVSRSIECERQVLESIVSMNPITMRKEELISRVARVVPAFSHVEKRKNLDQRM